MKIDESTIRHLEALSRIELAPDERELLAEQLDRIVAYVRQLQEVDTEGVEPTSIVAQEGRGELRPDEPQPSLDREEVLDRAPDASDRYFRVPKIIERSSDAAE